MNKVGLLIILAFFTVSSEVIAEEISIEEGKEFFRNYQKLDAAFDPAFIELYSDESLIHQLRRYPFGVEKRVVISGYQWKMILREALPVAKSRGDRSEYKNPRYDKNGKYLRIRAERHSLHKCFVDMGFYIDLERSENGGILIKEMYVETQSLSNC
jgi:hypothetical protein